MKLPIRSPQPFFLSACFGALRNSTLLALATVGASFLVAPLQAQSPGNGFAGFYRGTMHSYCPSFDYTDELQITVNTDGTVSAVVPARSSNYSSRGSIGGDGVITGLSIRVNSLSQGTLTIPYSATVDGTGAALAGSGQSADIRVDVQANRTAALFTGEVPLSGGVYYLEFPSGNPFGFYSYLADPHYIYHFDLGYEYVFDANDVRSGVYLYDFASQGFFYTSPSFPFPYLYDFSLNSVVYYYPDPSNQGRYNTNGVRYFYVYSTGQIISK